MKNISLIITAFFLLLGGFTLGQDIRNYAYYSLFSDYKALRVGDAITIIVVESSQASNNAETKTGRKSNIGYGVSGNVGNTNLPNLGFDLGSNNDFNGGGSTKTTGMIKTKISATIDSTLMNGNLLIKGSRRISINGEEQNIFIKGIVRPSDISHENTVMSYNISEAEIIFEGDGMINDSQKPGWLTKFFHWIF